MIIIIHAVIVLDTITIINSIATVVTTQWRIQDFWKGGSDVVLRAKRARIFRSHAHFRENHAHFRSFLRQTTSSTSPVDLFSNEFLLKHSKVSHSSSFLSSVARKGGSIYLTSVYFLVLGVAKGGFLCTPGSPSGSATATYSKVLSNNMETLNIHLTAIVLASERCVNCSQLTR